VDKQSVLKLSKNSVIHDHTKHIVIKHHFIRKKLQEGELQVYHVSSSKQLVDIPTKDLLGH
jgi:hypothetical protein